MKTERLTRDEGAANAGSARHDRRIPGTRLRCLTGCLVLACLAGPVPAWSQSPRRQQAAKPKATSKQDATREAADKKAQPSVLAIVGGDIHTVSREVIRAGTVVVQGSKILKVGQKVDIPKNATVIDAHGKHITPGFIALSATRLGTASSISSRGKVADALDPFDRDLKLALGVGITTACIEMPSSSSRFRFRAEQPGFLGLDAEAPAVVDPDDPDSNPDFGGTDNSVCPCCGLPILPAGPLEPITPSSSTSVTPQSDAVIKFTFGDLEGMLVSETPFFHLRDGALVGRLNRHAWRQEIKKGREYLDAVQKHEAAIKDGKKDRPPRKTVSDALIKLLKRESYLRVRAEAADEIRDMIRLAEELDYKLVIDGAAEGWVVADELSEAAAPVIFTPRRRRSPREGREATSGTSIEMSGTFEEVGVPFAVSTLSSSISLVGLAGRDLTSLPLEAAFAVRGGCRERTALAALTRVPAELMGLGDRLGTIEPGKDADLLILDGPPLDYRTYVEKAIVHGKVRYDRQEDRVYPVFDRATLR